MEVSLTFEGCIRHETLWQLLQQKNIRSGHRSDNNVAQQKDRIRQLVYYLISMAHNVRWKLTTFVSDLLVHLCF